MNDRIVIYDPGTGQRVPVKTLYLGTHCMESPPDCLYCGDNQLQALTDYIQHGFTIDMHHVAFLCPTCKYGMLVAYLVQIETETVPDDIPF